MADSGIRLGMLKCKIHRAVVTKADQHYQGSITIDAALMKAAGIINHEQVDVLNVTNGERFTTYAVPGKPGEIQINGAAAHLAKKGHIVIIIAYCFMAEKKAKTWQPKVVLVDAKNRIKK